MINGGASVLLYRPNISTINDREGRYSKNLTYVHHSSALFLQHSSLSISIRFPSQYFHRGHNAAVEYHFHIRQRSIIINVHPVVRRLTGCIIHFFYWKMCLKYCLNGCFLHCCATQRCLRRPDRIPAHAFPCYRWQTVPSTIRKYTAGSGI